ncbi:hypothetical protein RM780_07670 [Streptomyces sp. DSM 44917]|uniref:Uncharacterized protein n=1 Tax=Streptomyces boetiae TaxID=3075541 RepID=A0ABU2L5N1_9ACTN|nr:hypothetical protein [Streptomyces sp. DSM 44917]MDT0306840.1 hypothetical protein [Streptomyces sp. DSM 44917]
MITTALIILGAWIAAFAAAFGLLVLRTRRRATEAPAVAVAVPIGPGVQGAIPGVVLARTDHPAGGERR